MDSFTTVADLDAQAIAGVIRYHYLDSSTQAVPVTIFRDSQEVCQQIIGNTVAKGTAILINERTTYTVRTHGHVGMLGIDRADSLARVMRIRAPGIPHAKVHHSLKILKFAKVQ